MKIAILSDIHGNIYALKAVVKQMHLSKIDLVFFLGDQLGYYYDVEEVYNEIDQWNHHIIAGNHERIFLEYLNLNNSFNTKIDAKYGDCFSHYKDTFNSKLISRIKNLTEDKEVEIDGFKFLLCHGSPLDKDQYIYPDAKRSILDTCLKAATEFDVVFIGHTHYPMVYSNGTKTLINVGSVGQSRTVGGIANWGIFNTNNGVFSMQNTIYNTSNLEQKHKGSANNYLVKILKRNNE
jgi:putative phosphoesterase